MLRIHSSSTLESTVTNAALHNIVVSISLFIFSSRAIFFLSQAGLGQLLCLNC